MNHEMLSRISYTYKGHVFLVWAHSEQSRTTCISYNPLLFGTNVFITPAMLRTIQYGV